MEAGPSNAPYICNKLIILLMKYYEVCVFCCSLHLLESIICKKIYGFLTISIKTRVLMVELSNDDLQLCFLNYHSAMYDEIFRDLE